MNTQSAQDYASPSIESKDLFSSSINLIKSADYLYSTIAYSKVEDVAHFAHRVSCQSLKLAFKAWILEAAGGFRSGGDLANLYIDAVNHGFPSLSDPHVQVLSLLDSVDRVDREFQSSGDVVSEQDIASIRAMLRFFSTLIDDKIENRKA